jgi:predicted metal-dependent hydrolase
MQKEISTGNGRIAYSIKKSRRAKYMRLAVRRDLSVQVTIPWRFKESFAQDFLLEKSSWIFGKISYFEKNKSSIAEPNRKDYLSYKKLAKEIAQKKLQYFNAFYNFNWKKVCIRNPKSRWGSCSQKGNLNFSYRLVFLPEELCDYIIIHELCHLEEFNHSAEFWGLVGKTIPDYGRRREAIRKL